jgi:hypothetical protein
MPIEIKELIIRASIRDESEKKNGKSLTSSPGSSQLDAARDEQIINRCVEQIMEILKIKNER